MRAPKGIPIKTHTHIETFISICASKLEYCLFFFYMSLTIYLLRRHNALFSQKMRRRCAARNRYQLISCLNALQTIWKQLNSRISVFQHRPCKRGIPSPIMKKLTVGTRRVTIVAARKLLHDDEINSEKPKKKKMTSNKPNSFEVFYFFSRRWQTNEVVELNNATALMYATTFIVFFFRSFVLFIRKAIVLQYPAGWGI